MALSPTEAAKQASSKYQDEIERIADFDWASVEDESVMRAVFNLRFNTGILLDATEKMI